MKKNNNTHIKKYGLIGYPLGHSFSKKYFTEKFILEGIKDCVFELFPIQSIEAFPSLVDSNKNIAGLAVTVPYKESVIQFLNELDESAAEVGAVNCIRIDGFKYKGFNTDVIGFEKSFSPLLQQHHKKALVLGAGGSSKAIQFVLRKLGIEFLMVSRTPAGRDFFTSYDQINEMILQEYTIVINCTPVGTLPDLNNFPEIPYQFIGFRHLLFDLVYNPAETAFLKKGKIQGAVLKNGYEMLVIQAEANWSIWKSAL